MQLYLKKKECTRMKKFAVFSGFLGSGKTTTMMALTKYYTARHGKAAMISNDLGHGVNLADNRYAQLCGCNASEMTDECICYQNENLAERLNSCYDDGCELVISDIPGFGVGALEHVYHGLSEKFPRQFELAPFTVLVEPRTVSILQSGTGGDLAYLYDTQLVEADLIVLNKCDLIDASERDADLRWLSEHYPQAKLLAISALREEGLEELSQALKTGEASMRRPDIGYGGEAFMKAMGRISEFYLQYHAVVCCNDFDGDAYLMDMANQIQSGIQTVGYEIPHFKLLAWEPEGDFGKVDLLGTGRKIEVNHRFTRPCTELAVVLNASAACPAKTLETLVTGIVKEVSDKYQLELMIFKKECFGMGA
jgi:Putative GTPases (G3E family)